MTQDTLYIAGYIVELPMVEPKFDMEVYVVLAEPR